jgi:voltage-gated potassium channel
VIETLREIIRSLLPDRTLRLYLFLLLSQIVVYTVLIHHALPTLENRPITWMESLLFVLETITTVGYGDMLPFSNQITVGIVIVIMATGVFTVLMIIPVLLTPYLASMLRDTPPRVVYKRLTGHVVIIGYNELSKALLESIMISDRPIVVVEDQEDTARHIRRCYRRDVHILWGNYGDSATWSQAQVADASNVIINEDERTTATIILAIRERTQARIIAVVDDLAYDRYLRYAGAEYVLSPKNFTGKILARHAVLRPEADTIYEAISMNQVKRDNESARTTLRLIKAPIMEGCRCIGQTLGDLALYDRYGVDVLFFWKAGDFVLYPKDDDIIDTSTMLYLLGRAEELTAVLTTELTPKSEGEQMAVIAGYGDVGRAAYTELAESGINCVVVDPKDHDVPTIIGNAEYESVMKEAHIADARYLIVAVNDDNVNIFTTLIARNMNHDLRILARANDPASIDKLYRAGADYVALLPTIGGQVVAGIVLADVIQVLLDLPTGMKVVTKHIMKNVPTTVAWLQRKSGVRILGIEGLERTVVRPKPDEPLLEGDSIIAVGDIQAIKKFISLV